jgi:hypothetical protein
LFLYNVCGFGIRAGDFGGVFPVACEKILNKGLTIAFGNGTEREEDNE